MRVSGRLLDTSGARPNRAGLAEALNACSPGDVLVAWKLDRLGRSTLDLVSLVEKLKDKGVGLKVLTGEGASVDTTRPEGKLIFAVFAAFAEFERELIRERTKAGMLALSAGAGISAVRASLRRPSSLWLPAYWRRGNRNGKSPGGSAWPLQRCGTP